MHSGNVECPPLYARICEYNRIKVCNSLIWRPTTLEKDKTNYNKSDGNGTFPITHCCGIYSKLYVAALHFRAMLPLQISIIPSFTLREHYPNITRRVKRPNRNSTKMRWGCSTTTKPIIIGVPNTPRNNATRTIVQMDPRRRTALW